MNESDSREFRDRKNRYVTLDGLRGVAALMVVLFHTGHRVGPCWPKFGYLAVDLFFLLSGFVLAYNYEPRFRQGLGVSEFLVARAVRLYPLYLLGLVFAACVAFLNADLHGLTLRGDITGFCLGLLCLPSQVIPHGQVYVFALNPPFWSLFFEFWVANIVFVLSREFLDWKTLTALVIVSAIALILSEKIFFTLCVGYTWSTFIAGLGRVGFSFFAGVAIARLHAVRPPKVKLPSWVFYSLVVALMSLPLNAPLSHRYELLCVFVIFPAIVYWGAAASEWRPRLGALLGEASYPIYVMHYPLSVLAVWAILKEGIAPSLTLQLLFVLVAGVLAWGLSLADTRVRAILTVHVKRVRFSWTEIRPAQ